MPLFEATRTTDRNGRDVVIVVGDLDLATAPSMVASAKAEAPTADGRPLLLELSGVSFLDSTGLGALIEVRNVAFAVGHGVEIAAQSAAVERVLSLAGLSELFAVDAGDFA
ncbi:STAS domain-containing protein [soil metagenome]